MNVQMPIATSSQLVSGNFWVWSAASVSAPYDTNSPCGMKMTRVTENTSTSANANKA
ncbi:hypothetical protein PCA31118_01088 [Pandoraea captiosa]|uniref:Uncharacterized protein n=1 Tax=Pandoraea captiosa TaxID=2508302 RepID=A0A5E4ZP31_9BURK|nr:hypothetical protein PCA31118_01088 [Pandoraea captiosa]